MGDDKARIDLNISNRGETRALIGRRIFIYPRVLPDEFVLKSTLDFQKKFVVQNKKIWVFTSPFNAPIGFAPTKGCFPLSRFFDVRARTEKFKSL